jgi:hypothetical protein
MSGSRRIGPAVLLFATAAVLLSACGGGGGGAAVVRATGSHAIAQEVNAGVRNAVRVTAEEASHAEPAAVRATAVRATGARTTSGTTLNARYRKLVREELRSATVETLCGWLGEYIVNGALPSGEDFQSALIDNLASTRTRAVPPSREWVMEYVDAADSVAREVAGAEDLQAAVEQTMIVLACS